MCEVGVRVQCFVLDKKKNTVYGFYRADSAADVNVLKSYFTSETCIILSFLSYYYSDSLLNQL